MKPPQELHSDEVNLSMNISKQGRKLLTLLWTVISPPPWSM